MDRTPPDRVDVLRPPCCYSRRVNHLAAASSQLSFRHPSSIAGSGLESLRVSFPRAREGLSRTAPPPLLPFLPHASKNMAKMGRPRCPRQPFLSQFPELDERNTTTKYWESRPWS